MLAVQQLATSTSKTQNVRAHVLQKKTRLFMRRWKIIKVITINEEKNEGQNYKIKKKLLFGEWWDGERERDLSFHGSWETGFSLISGSPWEKNDSSFVSTRSLFNSLLLDISCATDVVGYVLTTGSSCSKKPICYKKSSKATLKSHYHYLSNNWDLLVECCQPFLL